MSDVFIAHVEEDANVALEIAIGLEEVGYTTWCYEVDSIPGPSYLIQTGQAVEQSKAVVVVISPHSINSRQVTKEIVRAHESGKDFIPILRDITHIEFQNRQPEWREAVGAAASVSITPEGVAGILPRIIGGLEALGILAGTKIEAARTMQIRKALGEAQGHTILEQDEELPAPAKKHGPESLAGEVPLAIEREERHVAASTRCAFHPEREPSAICTNCGKLICNECKTVLAKKIYCNPCAEKILLGNRMRPEKVTEKVTYNTALRWISGVAGVLFILGAITGLQYFAESGLASELIVDIVSIILAIALLLMAFIPQWVSAKLKIKLEKRSVFITALLVLVILFFIVGAFGPEPPGGWWEYGTL